MAFPYTVVYNGGLLNGDSSADLDACPVGWTLVIRDICVAGNTSLPTHYDWSIALDVADDLLVIASDSPDVTAGQYLYHWQGRQALINPGFLVVTTGPLSNEISYAITGYLLQGVTYVASPP